MEVVSVQQAAYGYVQEDIRAYLEGRQSFAWIVGCLRHSGVALEIVCDAIRQAKGYGDQGRWRRLAEEFGVGEDHPSRGVRSCRRP